jgi:acyl-CoA thioester hydrolase
MAADPDRQGPPHRAAFARFVSLATRWSDNDAYGHLNNVVYYALFDSAVNAILI